MTVGLASMNHMPTLDGLRGVAITLVLWYHAPYVFLDRYPPSLFWLLSIAGWMGVDLFFVVSGFLITTILLRTKRVPGQLQTFWIRRALRILPLAYLYLAVLLGNTLLGDPLSVLSDFSSWPLYFFYLGNVHIALNGFQPVVIMLLWSLAVEEQFYVVWPLAMRYLTARRLLRLCVCIIILAPLFRGFVVSDPAVYVLPFCRIDTLAVGAALAVLYNNDALRARTLSWCHRLLMLAGLVILLAIVIPFGPSYTRPWYFAVLGYSLLALAFTIVVGSALEGEGLLRAILTNRALMYVGKISYGVYMWHGVVGGMVKQFCLTYLPSTMSFNSTVMLWIVCVVGVASVSWFSFEKPLLDLKRRFPQCT